MRNALLLILAILLFSCNNSKNESLKDHAYTNDLIHETSPYLLQHAHNPVNWKAWNEETLEQARNEQKLMIVSIGYAACHWCHVMERETFEDTLAASVMNDNFIPVKVDREERPDVDQIYINAVQLMTGNAGWPLNVITLPDGRPIWGGTYFRKDDWIQSIQQIHDLYEEEPQRLEEYASKLEEGIKSIDLITLNTDEVDYSNFDITPVLDQWKESFDSLNGGYRRAPKFMMPGDLRYMLREAVQNEDQQLLDHVTLTLDKIAYGGVYDHIGGGFARYSVDEKWHIPHFEKMLYDNAQLVSLYSQAYQVTENPLYKRIVEESLDFVSREMTNETGAFYSSLDADSENSEGELVEGAFYVYEEEELQQQLGAEFGIFADYFNINEYGFWAEESSYVLIRRESDAMIAEKHSISVEELQQKKSSWKQILLDYRNQRPKPRLDRKTLTSWNGLMLKGYVEAYKVFQKQEYLDAALKNANFILDTQLNENGSLFHSYIDGKSTINGYLEDYAAVIDGFVSLYEVTLDDKWIEVSKDLADYTFEYFFDEDKGMFYFTSSEDAALVSRNMEYRDNVIPASNSIMAKNLFVLSHHYDAPLYSETALQMLKNVQQDMEKYPGGFSNWLDLMANYRDKYYEIVVVGQDAKELVRELNDYYIPNKLVAGTTTEKTSYLMEGRFVEGDTFIYVCVNNACKLPVRETSKALELIDTPTRK